MAYQGKITRWKDEQGFGFISPNTGGEPVFVHIKAFTHRHRRPLEGEIVTYQLATDSRGRVRAACVAFVDGRVKAAGAVGRGFGSQAWAGLFFVLLGVLVISGKLPGNVLAIYFAASLLAYIVYAWDKASARRNQWRTRESTLHLIALLGGWPGALVAQKVLRHKSAKTPFQVTFWMTVLINCGVLGWLLSAKGADVLRPLLG